MIRSNSIVEFAARLSASLTATLSNKSDAVSGVGTPKTSLTITVR